MISVLGKNNLFGLIQVKFSLPCVSWAIPMVRLKKINCMSQSCCAHLFFSSRLIQQNSSFQFFLLAYFFFHFFFMNLLVKIYMKRHDRHAKTLWTTGFFNSVFCLVSCSSKNQVPYFILNKVVTDSKFDTSAAKKKKKKKMHLGQVFQSLASFET